MKKTIGICLFTVLLVLCVSGSVIIWKNVEEKENMPEIQMAEETEMAEMTELAEEKTTELMKVQESYEFLIREQNGVLVVYDDTGSNVIFETNIKTQHLDATTLELLQEGIKVTDESELYALLESYSS